ncbi:hypothetical protein BU24DRAFT_405502 [Aaosphaeria arxii CBS 175.79]|uniref:Uncharacterized protein n=1 Tax=Aaosphaeria arxii CBS 175.79 TaxID=1450172 RepID=A0A6A5Y2E1_9PLEO|nr:uncharacterized protein BU24DRAFT_405502 [Aaosphaeria arxii CBS 175.79]KAF2018744.1 hypothetical protein BU24DRAFT_405502 [Aaosphaeria arxii CBS 175.79]
MLMIMIMIVLGGSVNNADSVSCPAILPAGSVLIDNIPYEQSAPSHSAHTFPAVRAEQAVAPAYRSLVLPRMLLFPSPNSVCVGGAGNFGGSSRRPTLLGNRGIKINQLLGVPHPRKHRLVVRLPASMHRYDTGFWALMNFPARRNLPRVPSSLRDRRRGKRASGQSTVPYQSKFPGVIRVEKFLHRNAYLYGVLGEYTIQEASTAVQSTAAQPSRLAELTAGMPCPPLR